MALVGMDNVQCEWEATNNNLQIISPIITQTNQNTEQIGPIFCSSSKFIHSTVAATSNIKLRNTSTGLYIHYYNN